MKKLLLGLTLLCSLGFNSYVFAADIVSEPKVSYKNVEPPQKEMLEKTVRGYFPDFPSIKEVKLMDNLGLYEVITEPTNVFYFDKGLNFIIIPNGGVIDMKSKQNLSQYSLSKIYPTYFKNLNYADAIKEVRGKGTRKLVVFADVNCGYCKKLFSETQSLKDITIYTFLVDILDSKPSAINVWCSKDSAKALEDLYLTGKAAATATGKCLTNNPIDRNGKLARDIGISGTPSLMFASGKFVPSYIPLEAIEEELKKPSFK